MLGMLEHSSVCEVCSRCGSWATPIQRCRYGRLSERIALFEILQLWTAAPRALQIQPLDFWVLILQPRAILRCELSFQSKPILALPDA
jgi:hypothetical protein